MAGRPSLFYVSVNGKKMNSREFGEHLGTSSIRSLFQSRHRNGMNDLQILEELLAKYKCKDDVFLISGFDGKKIAKPEKPEGNHENVVKGIFKNESDNIDMPKLFDDVAFFARLLTRPESLQHFKLDIEETLNKINLIKRQLLSNDLVFVSKSSDNRKKHKN